MSHWWTYRLSDFLMFSPRTYWRLVELYNRELWPLQLVAIAAGLLLLRLAARAHGKRIRWIAAALCVLWLWVGWGFHWERYATINWAAAWFAAAWWLQALLLLAFGVFWTGRGERPGGYVDRAGLALAAIGLLLYPAMGIVMGRPWTKAEVFGLMPEPTALVTLGLLWGCRHPRAGRLSVLPALSLAAGAATLWMLAP